MNIPLSPCVPENLASREGFSRPVPRQPAHFHTQAESGAYLRDSSRVPRRRPIMKPPYAIGSVPSLSGHIIAYRWRSLPRVHRHRVSKPQGSSERVLPSQVTMDPLICASLSHTHYCYEVGMLKVRKSSYNQEHPAAFGQKREGVGVGQPDMANNTLCRYCFHVHPFLAKKAPGAPVFGYCPFYCQDAAKLTQKTVLKKIVNRQKLCRKMSKRGLYIRIEWYYVQYILVLFFKEKSERSTRAQAVFSQSVSLQGLISRYFKGQSLASRMCGLYVDGTGTSTGAHTRHQRIPHGHSSGCQTRL